MLKNDEKPTDDDNCDIGSYDDDGGDDDCGGGGD